MEGTVAALAELRDRALAVVAGIHHCGMPALGDDELMTVLATAGDMLRIVESVLIEATGEVAARSESADRETRLTTRSGCRDVNELVQRATRCGPQFAGRLRRAATATRPRTSFLTGDTREAILPETRAAMLDGVIGVDGILAVAGPLADLAERVSRDDLVTADTVLAAVARGDGPDAAPPACADLLRVHAQAWATALDPDGAEPQETRALRKRDVTLGRARDGLVPIRGELLVEVAAQLQRIFDAGGAPDTAPRFRSDSTDEPHVTSESDAVTSTPGAPRDDRTHAQRRHDALAAALAAAAASGELPTIGGAAPTLVVSVREEDLLTGHGWAHLENPDEAVALAAARRVGCAGVIQRVLLGDDGQILRLGTEERVFNRHQRRAIALRDGGCVIPGCTVPAGWCEIHHVTEHSRGGPTHTDNGVLLCWYHHRFIDRGPWSIRMNHGVPEVRAPGWCDAKRRWRATTRSRPRLLNELRRRQT